MKIYYSKDKIEYQFPAIALGNFDGVHLGHQRVIENAKNNGKSFGVLLFRQHSEKNIKVITSFEEKIRILTDIGVDFIYVVDFDDNFKNMSLQEFAEFLYNIGIEVVSVGYDYRCAKGASADVYDLSAELNKYNIKTVISDEVIKDDVVVKSTYIRDLIKCGEVDKANIFMTRPLRLSGEVTEGLKNGRKLGFPTANIDVGNIQLLPGDGVYCAISYIGDDTYPAMVNIGKNPTFDADKRTVEAHIIGYDGVLYGENVKIDIYERIRGEIKFNSMDELSKQIKHDREYLISWREKLQCI